MSQAIRDNQASALDVLRRRRCARRSICAGEKPEVRERYGRNLFGQSVLLGRRLLDAGARLVQCNWQRTQGKNGFAWDTHWNNFSAHKEDLVPPFDRAFHALMTDLEQTGQLDETLVVVAAEFGRSPKITRSNSGREHWPDCYSRPLRRRRHSGRPGLRPVGQDRRLPRHDADHAGRLHRHHLPLSRHRSARRNPRPGQPAVRAVQGRPHRAARRRLIARRTFPTTREIVTLEKSERSVSVRPFPERRRSSCAGCKPKPSLKASSSVWSFTPPSTRPRRRRTRPSGRTSPASTCPPWADC